MVMPEAFLSFWQIIPFSVLTETEMSDPNDDRSNSMNQNNDAYQESEDNRSNQLNPNHDEYAGPERDDTDDD